jgi:hypothetical protein
MDSWASRRRLGGEGSYFYLGKGLGALSLAVGVVTLGLGLITA